MSQPLQIVTLGHQPYAQVWQAMRDYTEQRTADTPDQLWVVEHDSVFTQGLAGKQEHLLNTGDIPVVHTDRGGQVTWHGPGQLVVYFLLDIKRLDYGVRDLVNLLEQGILDYLAELELSAYARKDAPGVYLTLADGSEAKIASLGLRIRKGCSFHGLSLNVTCALDAFQRINPCGYAGMQVTRLADWVADITLQQASEGLLTQLVRRLQADPVTYLTSSQVQA